VILYAVICVVILCRRQKRQAWGEEVSQLRLDIAAIRGNIKNAFNEGIGILNLYKGLRQDWVQASSYVDSHVIFTDIPADGGVCKILIVVTRRHQSDERCKHQRPLTYVIPEIGREILKSRMVFSVVRRKTVGELRRAVIFPENIWQRYPYSELVGEGVIRVHGYGLRVYVAEQGPRLPLVIDVILDQNVLIAEGDRALASREQPSLPRKRTRNHEHAEDNNDPTGSRALNGIRARQGFALVFIAISIIFRN